MRTSCGPAADEEEQAKALANESLATTFKTLAGEKILPIRLKIRVFGDEVEKVVYNTLSLYLLLKQLQDMTGLDAGIMKVKAIEDARIRRIDNKFKTDEAKMVNSLLDLEIYDGTPIVVEVKEEDELEEEAGAAGIGIPNDEDNRGEDPDSKPAAMAN